MAHKQPIELIGLEEKKSFDITTIREKLANATGRQLWRSLDELAQTSEFQSYLHHEFPNWATRLAEPVSRRNFLKFMGASLAMAGLSGCNTILHPQPLEKIAPYTEQPEYLVAGNALYYATAATMGGVAIGLLVESNMGRPTKLEGNPNHPASLGATDALTQASILSLYDPERSQAIKQRGRISSWQPFLNAIGQAMQPQRANDGAGLRILTDTVTSPTLTGQINDLLEQLPLAKWHQYEPVNRDNGREGAILAFGEPVNTYYDLTKAKVILSLEADFLISGPGSVRYARDFADQRRVRDEGSHEMNRLYVVESSPTGTGSIADNRLPLQSRKIESLARQVAAALGVGVETDEAMAEYSDWITVVVEDLQAHAGESLVIAGDQQPPAVHAIAHAINQSLGNTGRTVIHTDPIEGNSVNQHESLRELMTDMETGSVELLIILGGNPVFDAPADLEFVQHLENVPLRVHLGLYENETSMQCHWHIPQTHFLETWSDARAYDGTVTVMQPLIAPLYDGHSAHEIISVLLEGTTNNYQIVRDYWQSQAGEEVDIEEMWQNTVHDGMMADSTFSAKLMTANTNLNLPAPEMVTGLEINFRPDPTIWDGRFINNGWLQEIPKPLTKLTWDNAALISPSLADERNLNNGDMVTLQVGDQSLDMPVWILPGQAKETVTVHFGYGRTRTGRVGQGTGFNVYPLRTTAAPWMNSLTMNRVSGGYYELISTQNHGSMEGRDIIRHQTLEEFLHPHEEHEGHHYQSLHSDNYETIFEYDGYAWGLSIDLGSCIGCNACVAACNVENNMAIVGKEEVGVGREMHWMRIDRYFAGPDLDNPAILYQPLMCQQCEQAPCEVVCPVAATVHSAEGLNDMVYNRCVGTRFCANNCPYKVRRFNFYQYQETAEPVLELRHNPDVTVRSRGVMEKCSFCVQRINKARITAKKEQRDVQDGEIQTACQQACPTRAIVFGDTRNSNTEVAQLKAESRNYSLLAELNTKPRATYLAKLSNPNPAISGNGDHQEEGGH